MAGLGWRWTRGRGPKQFSLIVCAAAALIIVLLGKAQASIFDNARATLSDWTAPALSQLRQPLLTVERWVGDAGGIFTVYRENRQLRQENTELHKWQDVALSLENRLRRYEILLNAVPDPKPAFITAKVIGESNRPFVKTIILDAGTRQRVTKGQAVMDERGLLGRIYVTGEQTSWVILLTDLNSRVPVVIEPSHRRALLVGDNSPAPQLELDVGDGPIKAGDRVLSTGDGGLLPPDIPIGVVMGDIGDERVALYATPASSDFVHVMDYRVPDPPAAAPISAAPVPAGPVPTVDGHQKVTSVVVDKSNPAADNSPARRALPPPSNPAPEEQDR